MFSIVVPVRDKPHTIRRTLASALAQTYPDFELILVGARSDESLAMGARTEDPRVRTVFHSGLRQGPARNAGIEASRNEWIAFLDADDLWLPGHLAELDEIRRRHPEAGLIGTRFIDSDAGGRFDLPAPQASDISLIDFFDEVGRGRNILCSSSAAIPKHSYARLGGFGESAIGEDSEFWARIALCSPVAVSRRATAVYLHGTGGIADKGRDRWKSGELLSVRDLSPAVAFLVDRYAGIEPPALRRSIDRYIRRYCDQCLHTSIALGDFRTVRRLRRAYWRRPTAKHALLLAIAALPRPLARTVYSLGFRLKARLRRRAG